MHTLVIHVYVCTRIVMVSGRFLALCAAGLAGSLFVGYCIYFDKRRRNDPDYKKKVLSRKRRYGSSRRRRNRRRRTASKNTIDLRDPKVREEFLSSEMMKANQKITEGNIEEAVGHFINVVHFSGDPRRTLLMLQQCVPAQLFSIICRAYSAVQENNKGLGVEKEKKTEEFEID